MRPLSAKAKAHASACAIDRHCFMFDASKTSIFQIDAKIRKLQKKYGRRLYSANDWDGPDARNIMLTVCDATEARNEGYRFAGKTWLRQLRADARC